MNYSRFNVNGQWWNGSCSILAAPEPVISDILFHHYLLLNCSNFPAVLRIHLRWTEQVNMSLHLCFVADWYPVLWVLAGRCCRVSQVKRVNRMSYDVRWWWFCFNQRHKQQLRAAVWEVMFRDSSGAHFNGMRLPVCTFPERSPVRGCGSVIALGCRTFLYLDCGFY